MFSSSVQPGLVSLFSSTGSDPLSLFSSKADTSLQSDSFICLLHDATSQPAPSPPRSMITANDPDEDDAHAPTSPNYALDQTVLHIQSPTVKTTYILCPPAHLNGAIRGRGGGDLGLKHPWIHFQVRNMGREWAFEVGIVDQSGREGILRCSTFQKRPRLKLTNPPLLHLPLSFPTASSRPLTSWSAISLNLPSFLPHFSSASLAHTDDDDEADGPATARQLQGAQLQVPSGTYSHVSYVKVYATCRLRRIWFSEGGPQQRLPWEFQLYAAENP
ncbi:hypothetical protein L227DRAFT_656524 [Lentinus tigrinus ALCF2SS1-6]|uniref:CFA20 domain-containing protein n=1 Tax=Lentinus tigrinus ALCF2SS1-6 TaxID=1328759 RepID=A0A5C2RY48_9APHY|nr:hypothetical protein L227DRAFT_656524 [Lentinus tigrinus ALCF2SS1-6]